MDTKTAVMETMGFLKEALGEAWGKLTVEEQQLAADVAEEVVLSTISVVLLGDEPAKDRLDRAKASSRALAFGGALIARGVMEEKILEAAKKGFQLVLSFALSKL